MERALMLGNLNKNTKRKEVKKMKKKGLKIGIISLLTLGLLGFYLLSPALAENDPNRGSTTQIIDIYFGYDQSGHLTSQTGSQTINGVDLQGNSFTTTIELNYDVINGKAVLLSSTSTTTASNPDGSSRTSSTTTNYHYNENGILMSADGSGSAHGWEKDQLDWVDEDGDGIQDTDDDGNLLYYDADGNHTFLENNRGQKQWKQMQRQLNKALDSIAARSDNPAEALQVEVMAMGESSDADFPAIYADLFGERTFDNSKGGWSYEVFNSFGLPDFLG